jgi:PAS domain S-box-containing protein
MEAALRQSRRNLDNCFNTLEDFVFVVGLDGQIIYVNSQVERRLGYSRQDAVGRHVLDVHSPDRRDEAARIFAEMLAGRTTICPVPLQAKDGTQVDVETRITHGEWDGQPVLFGISRDIRERLETERALRDSQEKLAGVLDAVADQISMIDEEHNIVWANGVAKRLYGADLPGKKCYRVYHERDEPCERCLTRRTFADGRHHELERKLTGNGEERIYWCTSSVAARYDDGRPRLVIEVARDVTDRKRAEEESRRHLAELAHVTRVATMGEMVSGIAHEVNQPLTAIASSAGTCLNILEKTSLPINADLYESLGRIEQQAVRAGRIVHRLRDFVRRTPPVRAACDLNDLVREALGWMQPELERVDVTLKQSLTESLPAVVVDPIQIEQVILNLVKNAVDAISSESNGRRQLSVSTEAPASDRVQVTVCDSGPGLPAEDRDRIFDAFVTSKPDGLGMGLAISRSIIETHGGRLWMTPNPDRGCTFRFDLPLAVESPDSCDP